LALALQALGRSDTLQARQALREALTRSYPRVAIDLSRNLRDAGYFSPDGSLFVIAYHADRTGRDPPLEIRRTASGELVALMGQPAVHSETIAFSPDGRRLLTGDSDGRARVWETGAGALLHTLVHAGAPDRTWAAYEPQGTRLLTHGQGRLKLWSADGTPLADWASDGAGPPLWSPNGEYVGAGNTVWHLSSGKSSRIPQCQSLLAFQESGTRVACEDGNDAFVWDVLAGKAVARYENYDLVKSAAFSSQGDLATVSEDMAVRVWSQDSLTPMKVIATEPVHAYGNSVSRVAFSPDGAQLVSTTTGGNRLWDARSGVQINVLQGAGAAASSDFRLAVTWNTFRREKRHLAVASLQREGELGTLSRQRWDLSRQEDAALLREFEDSDGAGGVSPLARDLLTKETCGAGAMLSSKDASAVAGQCRDKSILIVDANKATLRRRLGASDGIAGVSGATLVVRELSGALRIVDLLTGQPGAVIPADSRSHVAVSAASGLVAVIGDNEVRLVDLQGRQKQVIALAQSAFRGWLAPDGERLLLWGDAGVTLWNTRSGQRIGRLATQQRLGLRIVEFSPNGQWVATLSQLDHFENAEARIAAAQGRCVQGYCPQVWNLKDGALVAELPGHIDAVDSLRFHSNNRWIAAKAEAMRFHTLDADELKAIARHRLGKFRPE